MLCHVIWFISLTLTGLGWRAGEWVEPIRGHIIIGGMARRMVYVIVVVMVMVVRWYHIRQWRCLGRWWWALRTVVVSDWRPFPATFGHHCCGASIVVLHLNNNLTINFNHKYPEFVSLVKSYQLILLLEITFNQNFVR